LVPPNCHLTFDFTFLTYTTFNKNNTMRYIQDHDDDDDEVVVTGAVVPTTTDTNPNSNSTHNKHKRKKKTVSFQLAQTMYFGSALLAATSCTAVSEEELKSSWYTERELHESREEARRCLEALIAVGGKLDLLNSQSGEIFCTRGIEKFANVALKVRARRLLVTSVLGQQRRQRTSTQWTNCGSTTTVGLDEELASVSRYLTQPSRELAYSLGLMNAQHVYHDDDDATNSNANASSERTGVHETEQEQQAKDAAARALLCMVPPVGHTLHQQISPPHQEETDQVRGVLHPPPPSKRQRVLLNAEQATLALVQ
jgi:hypothetical protein